MLYAKNLVDLIERNAEDLTLKWLDTVKNTESMPTYRTYDEKKLYHRAFRVYSQLEKWISLETTKGDIAKHYTALGAQRCVEGFNLSEVLQSLIIQRRILWLKVQSDGFLDTALDMKTALELNNRVILFFDRASFYVARGYEKQYGEDK